MAASFKLPAPQEMDEGRNYDSVFKKEKEWTKGFKDTYITGRKQSEDYKQSSSEDEHQNP